MGNIELVKLLFSAAHIQRWNDHIRAHNFTELDKQAHKMVIAYVLARHEEDSGKKIDWLQVIEGGIFEFLHRIVLTDIKPPVFYLLQERYQSRINNWVVEQLAEVFREMPKGFRERFVMYLNLESSTCLEKKVLQASHYLATKWEFKFIYDLNRQLYGIEETKSTLEREIEKYYDLESVQRIALYKHEEDFIDLVGQLRFQKRWTQIPRVPETSVLGHMLMVAIFAYLISKQHLGACERRTMNNFYAGLFHDLPEVLTRDIISPVKRSIQGLDEIIRDIETMFMEQKIYPLIPDHWRNDLRYYTADEFKTKITDKDNKVSFLKTDEMNSYNEDTYNPLDGEMLKFCDNLSAMLEVLVSKQHGITSKRLEKSLAALVDSFQGKEMYGMQLAKVADTFEKKLKI